MFLGEDDVSVIVDVTSCVSSITTFIPAAFIRAVLADPVAVTTALNPVDDKVVPLAVVAGVQLVPLNCITWLVVGVVAATAVPWILTTVSGMLAFADPLNDPDVPVASPVPLIVRPVCRIVADPALPVMVV
jgi:hypothetical protein